MEIEALLGTLDATSSLVSSLWQSPWVTPQPFSFANCARQSCTASLHTHRADCIPGMREMTSCTSYQPEVAATQVAGCKHVKLSMTRSLKTEVQLKHLPQTFSSTRISVNFCANKEKLLQVFEELCCPPRSCSVPADLPSSIRLPSTPSWQLPDRKAIRIRSAAAVHPTGPSGALGAGLAAAGQRPRTSAGARRWAAAHSSC